MTEDSHFLIKQYWDNLFQSTKAEAISDAQDFLIKLKSDQSDERSLLISLNNELNSISNSINDLDQSAYYYFGGQKDWLFQYFFTRIVLYDCNDKLVVKEAFSVVEKQKLLINSFIEVAKKQPAFSYDDFIAGKDDVLFYELNYNPAGMPEDEYLSCRAIQSDFIFKYVIHNFLILTNNFLTRFNSASEKKELLIQEHDLLDNLFDKLTANDQIIDSLKLLTGFDGVSIITKDDFEFRISDCFNGNVKYFSIKYCDLKAYKLYKAKKIDCSIPQLIGLTLINYSKWIEDFLKSGEPNLFFNQVFNDDYFESIYSDMIEQVKEHMIHYKDKFPELLITQKEFKDLIFGELYRIRILLNTSNLTYYNILENKAFLKSAFLGLCLTKGIAIQYEELKKIIQLNEELVHLANLIKKSDLTIVDIDKSRNALITPDVFNSLVFRMAPDNKVINQLIQIYSDLYKNSNIKRKPLFFIYSDLQDGLIEVYEQAINNLTERLANTPGENKLTFVISTLKDLKLKLVECKRLNMISPEILNNLIDIYQIEQEAVNHLSIIKANQVNKLLKSVDIKEKPKLSFNFQKSDIKIIEPFIKALVLEIDLLDESRTSIAGFLKVLSSTDLTKETTNIYFGCQTNEIRYVVKKLKPYFKHLTHARIEQSKLFYSNNGTLLVASNLDNSKLENLQTKKGIDNIFNQWTTNNI